MRSAAESEARRPSLLGRVALASGLAAALGGAVAAVTAGVATRALVRSSDDASLFAAATRMAQELADDDDDPIAEVIEEELEEVGLADARVSVRAGDTLVAGERALPVLAVDRCASTTLAGAPMRACAVAAGDLTLVLAASSARADAIQPLFAWGAVLGVLLGSLFGALVSTGSARWALAPLSRLRAQVEAIDSDAPRSEALASADHAEIEALRVAVADLVDRLGAAVGHAQRFALDAAHELRTPLTTIAGELELLAESEVPDPAALARVRASVGDLVVLVQRLLVLAAPPLGPEGPMEAVDLADVAAEVHAALADRERVEVSVREDVLVRGDAMLLRIALGNAIENALKFSSGRVRVRVDAEGEDARVTVDDEGAGVAPRELARVFEPFYRSATARASKGGHGLGLSLIAHVAASHGGHARFEPVPSGARLRITLPRWRVLA